MSPSMVLLPAFVQVGRSFRLGVRPAMARRNALLRGDIRLAAIALGRTPWPDQIEQFGDAYQNQFELPVAFYALAAFAIITSQVDLAFVALAWLFVGSRIAHAFVHTTSNHIPTRFRLFALGAVILLVMWVIFAVRILSGAL